MHGFEVQSLTCGHCASRVTQALTNLDAMAKVEIDMAVRYYVRAAEVSPLE